MMVQPPDQEHNTMPTLMKAELESLTANIFRHAGAPDDLAQQVAQVLVDNHLAGHDSHGILQIGRAHV